jgi:hypothetical protein
VVVVVAACSGGAAPTTTNQEVTSAPSISAPPATTSAAPTTAAPTTTAVTTTPAPDAPACPIFSEPQAIASVQSPDLNEISGLAVGRTAPDLLWVHNDSGDGALVYGIGTDGATATVVALDGIFALDWEDMEIALGPDGLTPYLYVADTGDNLAFRPTVIIHRFPEPSGVEPQVTARTASLVLTYPDGPRDAEAMFVDPQSQQLVIITKQDALIYTAPMSAFETGRAELTAAGRLVDPIRLVTAASSDADGAWIAVRTPASVLLWARSPSQTVGEALAGEPCELPAPEEIGGEAIGLDADGQKYVTISEGTAPDVNVSNRE